ncbi:hypothetical protein K435DRAFT_878589 [Dendrothele bispora CBS 962.96]|uniref:Uncharacterized protein n=1 Tax=Dendrothele bispora (strain CBS 962.96) TaxID=1314807 RepID=A0A4S8KMV4_DENBC|nr:hypothetical protein K435DRAFT_878589 [Dendrothele bispora CBS 962.96]
MFGDKAELSPHLNRPRLYHRPPQQPPPPPPPPPSCYLQSPRPPPPSLFPLPHQLAGAAPLLLPRAPPPHKRASAYFQRTPPRPSRRVRNARNPRNPFMDRESSRLSFYTHVTPRLFQSRKPRMQSATTSANNSTPPTFPSSSPQVRSTFKATAGSRSRKRPVGDPKGPSVHYEHVATKAMLTPRLPPPSLPINHPVPTHYWALHLSRASNLLFKEPLPQFLMSLVPHKSVPMKWTLGSGR